MPQKADLHEAICVKFSKMEVHTDEEQLQMFAMVETSRHYILLLGSAFAARPVS